MVRRPPTGARWAGSRRNREAVSALVPELETPPFSLFSFRPNHFQGFVFVSAGKDLNLSPHQSPRHTCRGSDDSLRTHRAAPSTTTVPPQAHLTPRSGDPTRKWQREPQPPCMTLPLHKEQGKGTQPSYPCRLHRRNATCPISTQDAGNGCAAGLHPGAIPRSRFDPGSKKAIGPGCSDDFPPRSPLSEPEPSRLPRVPPFGNNPSTCSWLQRRSHAWLVANPCEPRLPGQ